MKRKFFAVFMALMITFLGVVAISNADSGWDYDYDSGWDSDWDWGDNDYYTGGTYYDGGSSDGGSILGGLIFMIVIIVIIVLCNRNGGSSSYKPTPSAITNTIPTVLGDEAFSNYPNFNKEKFLEDAFNIYKSVQIAWMDFDYESLRKLTTDEMYNMYKMQLETLDIKGQKNIMKDFNKSFIGITAFGEVNGVLTATVRLNVSQKDYVVNKNTNEVLRGDANRTNFVAYDLTFVQNTSKNVLTTCPNCGAPIENSGSQKCEYCGADLVGNSVDTWVLAKKENIRQAR